MRKCIFLLIAAGTALFLSYCSQNSALPGSKDRHDKKMKKAIIKIAEDYAAGNISDSKKKVMKNGLITIGNTEKTYIIDTSKIFIGLIDQDTIDDAIISLDPFQGNYEVINEQLVIINMEGKLRLIRTLESDMRIIGIKDGIITAEIPEHTRNSPLFNCHSCWEVVRYRFINGELIRTD
jgi:hypothetical protein